VQSSFQNLYVLDYHYFVTLLIFCFGHIILALILWISSECCRIKKLSGKARPIKTLSVVVGAHRIFDHEPSQRRLQVEEVVINEIFRTERPRYDMALVRLNSTIEFNDEVAPICVDRSRFPDFFANCVVTGWGRTSTNGLSVTFSLSF